MRKILILLALSLAFVVGAYGQAVVQTANTQPANNVLGEVVAVDAASKQIFVKTDAGAVVIVTVPDTAKIVKNPPGETKLDKSTPYTLAQIATGDRLLALGKLSDDGKTLPAARAVVVNTKAEVAAKHEAESAEWRRRGIVGVVSAINPATKEITLQTRTAEGPKPVIIPAGGTNVKLRRYAPDSIKFADAKPSAFEEVKVGDQLRAKGDRTEDGARFNAEEVVTGTFRTAIGTITAIDPAKNEITVKQAQDSKPLTIVVRPDSVLKQIPADIASMMMGGGGAAGGPGGGGTGGAAGGAPGAAGGERRVIVQGGAGGAQGGGPGQGQGGGQAPGGAGGGGRRMGGGGGDMVQQMLERMPPVTLAELKPGTMIIVSSTVGVDPTRVTAIQLVSGIEPLVAMMSRRSGGMGGPGGGAAGGLGGAGGGGGLSFGFGIGQP
ncbi:MAG: hypothetical protein QOC99_1789 [Acidobacteriota bacterium]|nr:hypothetical protein [Acidobacteriota bacterium]